MRLSSDHKLYKPVLFVVFCTHLILTPIGLNLLAIGFYGDMSSLVYFVIFTIHMTRAICPAAIVIISLHYNHLKIKYCPLLMIYFYSTTLASVVVQCIRGYYYPSVAIYCFLMLWCTLAVFVFIKIGQQRQTFNLPSRTLVIDLRSDTSESLQLINNTITLNAKTIPNRSGNDFIDNCSICLQELTTQLMETGCGHVYHARCLLEWSLVKQTCPLCNLDLK